MVIKITNCTTTTGGGMGTPIRWRQNQNIKIVISDKDNPNDWSKPNICFIRNGRKCYTTVQSKSIIIK